MIEELSHATSGLSPRVRGNRIHRTPPRLGTRSIPACAGEPSTPTTRRCAPGVYPRVCGGTTVAVDLVRQYHGLSPRVRGNHQTDGSHPVDARSIPACAGEPYTTGVMPPMPPVYPRVCGGTMVALPTEGGENGLSPRVRGNPTLKRGGDIMDGSIPACAGEPTPSCVCSGAATVYPRVCGGTGAALRESYRHLGLSPRVRGNPAATLDRLADLGSIPACAGEPGRRTVRATLAAVYPRVCGGTADCTSPVVPSSGLSPRVRGNRCVRAPTLSHGGSIPACAGEPVITDVEHLRPRVYPRVCGGTVWLRSLTYTPSGLSPRVRGNH